MAKVTDATRYTHAQTKSLAGALERHPESIVLQKELQQALARGQSHFERPSDYWFLRMTADQNPKPAAIFGSAIPLPKTGSPRPTPGWAGAALYVGLMLLPSLNRWLEKENEGWQTVVDPDEWSRVDNTLRAQWLLPQPKNLPNASPVSVKAMAGDGSTPPAGDDPPPEKTEEEEETLLLQLERHLDNLAFGVPVENGTAEFVLEGLARLHTREGDVIPIAKLKRAIQRRDERARLAQRAADLFQDPAAQLRFLREAETALTEMLTLMKVDPRFFSVGTWSNLERVLAREVHLAEKLELPLTLLSILIQWANVLTHLGLTDQASGAWNLLHIRAQEALLEAVATGDTQGQMEVLSYLALAHEKLGLYAKAIQTYEAMGSLARGMDNYLAEWNTRFHKIRLLIVTEQFQEAVAEIEAADFLAEEMNLPVNKIGITPFVNIAQQREQEENWDAAGRVWLQAASLLDSSNVPIYAMFLEKAHAAFTKAHSNAGLKEVQTLRRRTLN